MQSSNKNACFLKPVKSILDAMYERNRDFDLLLSPTSVPRVCV